MKACLLVAGLMISLAGFAQEKFLPAVKGGTKMQYVANVNGQDIPVGFKIDSIAPDYLKIGWSVEGYGEGAWVMKQNSLQSATGSLGENPEPGVEQVLPDDKTQLVLSKDQWGTVAKDKKLKHNNVEFSVVAPAAENAFKVGEKPVDVVYLESADKSSKLWILNSPTLPLIVKVVGNTGGPDLTLLSLD